MRVKIELQRMIDNAYKQIRDGNKGSQASEMFIEHYETLQRRYVRTFGETYQVPETLARQINLESLEEVARTCAG